MNARNQKASSQVAVLWESLRCFLVKMDRFAPASILLQLHALLQDLRGRNLVRCAKNFLLCGCRWANRKAKQHEGCGEVDQACLTPSHSTGLSENGSIEVCPECELPSSPRAPCKEGQRCIHTLTQGNIGHDLCMVKERR